MKTRNLSGCEIGEFRVFIEFFTTWFILSITTKYKENFYGTKINFSG